MSGDIKPRPRRRIVLCMGEYCNRGGQAEPLYECLRQSLGEIVPAWAASGPLRWETANCLSMCGAGPNLVIYPGGHDHHYLDVKRLQAIIEALLKDDTVNHTP